MTDPLELDLPLGHDDRVPVALGIVHRVISVHALLPRIRAARILSTDGAYSHGLDVPDQQRLGPRRRLLDAADAVQVDRNLRIVRVLSELVEEGQGRVLDMNVRDGEDAWEVVVMGRKGYRTSQVE